MKLWKKLVLGTIILSVSFIGIVYVMMRPPQLPPLEEDGYFGPGDKPKSEDTSIEKITLSVGLDAREDLQKRLENTRSFSGLEGVGFEYGFNADFMKEILEYWKTQYKWDAALAELNQYSNYMTEIEGVKIHFLRASGAKPGRPLLILHGWPSSVWEFHKVLPFLTHPDQPGAEPFDVIIPSLPGYGFSQAPHKPGLNQRRTARIMHKLMQRLNIEEYYVHGTDWGDAVATFLAQLYPAEVLGLHLTMFPVSNGYNPMTVAKTLLSMVQPSWLMPRVERERFGSWGHQFTELVRKTGYFHLQATRPDTPGFGLHDSPVGLAAYILEKYADWTTPEAIGERDGGLSSRFDPFDLLTQVSIYWYNGNIASSMRYYKELANDFPVTLLYGRHPVTVPTALASYPAEISITPYFLANERFTDLLVYTIMPRGGHFPALEEPELWVENIFDFVERLDKRSAPKEEL